MPRRFCSERNSSPICARNRASRLLSGSSSSSTSARTPARARSPPAAAARPTAPAPDDPQSGPSRPASAPFRRAGGSRLPATATAIRPPLLQTLLGPSSRRLRMNLQEGCRGKLSHEQIRKRYFPFWQHQHRWWSTEGGWREPCHLAYHTVAELAGGSSNVRFAQQRTFFENAIADHATHPSSALSIYSIGPHRRRQRRHSDPAAQ